MPAKKDPSVRARRNASPTRATLSDATVVPIKQRPALPPLIDSETGEVVPWHEQTLDWWAGIWSAPMAGQWHESDRFRLFRIAVLVNRMWVGALTMSAQGMTQIMAELRMQEQDFGLAPYARRRLEWTIEQSEEAQDRGTRRRAAGAAAAKAGSPRTRKAAASDPRVRALSAV